MMHAVSRPERPLQLRAFIAVLVAFAFLLMVTADTRALATGTEYVTFWSGDLRIFALEDGVVVELTDIDTGLPLVLTGPSKDPRINSLPAPTFGTNPFTLLSAGDSFEARGGLGGINAEIRVRITSSEPVTVWTGSKLTVSNNPWMSYIPAFSAAESSNGTEIGSEFLGFTSKEMYIFVRKGVNSTVVEIDDLATNNDADTDDTQILTAASLPPELDYSDSEIDVFYVTGFEDDTVRVTTNADASVLVGLNSRGADNWTATPPSYAAGDDGIELGTLFYTFVRDTLTIFPTEDDTTVTVTDLSDAGGAGDDTATVVLANGDTVGNYDIYTTDLGPIIPRSSPPLDVTIISGPDGAFENDYVKIESDKPVLAYVGPAASDINEYADVAFSVPTGPDSRIVYVFAQNSGSSNDLQIFGFDPDTEVTITSLSRTSGFRASVFHDFTIGPGIGGPSGWKEGVSTDVWWGSDVRSAEMLRIESNKPITVISGDYDTPHFGAYIPFVLTTSTLPPVAIAAADPITACTNDSIEFDGAASFDQDTVGPGIVTYEWDFDTATDTSGDAVPDNDVDGTGAVVNHVYGTAGAITVKLTVTDNEGETDTDFVQVTLELCLIEVTVDIKPGSDPNSVNLNGNGVVPIGIFGAAGFDVHDIDVATVLAGVDSNDDGVVDPDGAAPVHTGHIEDLDGDGLDDVVFHFREHQLGIQIDTPGNTIVPILITGQLTDGTDWAGTDVVRITPNNDKSRGKGGKGPQ